MREIKRKRSGQKPTASEEEESESDDELHRGIYDSDSDMQVLSEFEDDEYDEHDGKDRVRESLRPSNRDGDDADFVVEDDEIGVPSALKEMPLEFTRHSHERLNVYFAHVVEWLVQKKVRCFITDVLCRQRWQSTAPLLVDATVMS